MAVEPMANPVNPEVETLIIASCGERTSGFANPIATRFCRRLKIVPNPRKISIMVPPFLSSLRLTLNPMEVKKRS